MPVACLPATEGDTEKEISVELADIFRLYGEEYRQNHPLPPEHLNVMRHIEQCRTAAVGGHKYRCCRCGYEHNAYNSCGDRHCPKCQSMAKEQWLNERRAELLPVSYYHLVFTIAHELNPLILCNKKLMLDMLFEAVNDTLKTFSSDPQWRINGQLGFIAILHSWSQTLTDHFHLHVLVPAGVIDTQGQFKAIRENYLFRNESLADLFKKRYLSKIQRAYQKGLIGFHGQTDQFKTPEAFDFLISTAKAKDWNVFAKRPFAGPQQVLDYLGRYTHRVAISNNRILSVDNGQVVFSYKNRKLQQTETMSLPIDEFIRRFLLHVLPDGFMKIRYFGFLSNKSKRDALKTIRKQLDIEQTVSNLKESVQEIMLRLTGIDIFICPKCKEGTLFKAAILQPISSPTHPP
jgi:predicted Zn-ribbon and HTH transcriptional regulator